MVPVVGAIRRGSKIEARNVYMRILGLLYQGETPMNTPLSGVLAKIAEIAKKSADDDYIYRGESKFHTSTP